MKKLLLLGGSRYAVPVIEAAHKLGVYVITADYLPGNIAHKHSDEYCNVSVIEKDKVLEEALKRTIDGIMSFACDPGVMTAAYVAEKMGLPFQCSYKAAKIFQDKGRFRQFLTSNGFNCPHAKRYADKKRPLADVDFFTWPVIVKPVDSAGSKGVTKVENPAELEKAAETAIQNSHGGHFIIEDFITFEGFHSSTDMFTINGELKFVAYSDQLFDSEADNPYVPAKIIWPSSMKKEHQNYLTREIQRLMTLLKTKNGIYNIETCVGANGMPYIMEVSPRGGGCKIAEIQKLAYGIDFIENEIKSALAIPLDGITQTECNGVWCEFVVHAKPGEAGIFKRLAIDEKIKRQYVKVVDLSVKPGALVKPFTGANMALGDMFLKFESRDELDDVMANVDQWFKIELTENKCNGEFAMGGGGDNNRRIIFANARRAYALFAWRRAA